MKRIFLALAVLLAAGLTFGAPVAWGQVVDRVPGYLNVGDRLDHARRGVDSIARLAVRVANRQWRLGKLQNDAVLLDSLLADDWTITEGGVVENKANYLADVRSGERSYEFIDDGETSVRLSGDTAVLTGHTTSKGYVKDQQTTGTSLFTRTFALQFGRWRMISSHSAVITL